MPNTTNTLAQRHYAKHTTLYNPYFWKPSWACSPDAATFITPNFGTGNNVIINAKLSDQMALCTARIGNPFAHSRAPRSSIDSIAYLVQETAASPHDAKACIITTELQKHGLIPFTPASISRVAQGSSASASPGSAASNSLSDMAISSQRPSVTTYSRGFSDDIAAKKSVPVVHPGLGYGIPISSAARCIAQAASFGVIGDRGGEDPVAKRGLEQIAGVISPSDSSRHLGSCAIPCIVAPKNLDLKGIACAFSGLSAHFMYSLALQAGADEFFPDPQLHGRTYVTSVIGSRIQSILECVSNPQVVAIHALWYISKITTADACHGIDFLGISVFNHLYCIGFSSLEDLVFSAFAIAARLADKSVNDTCLASNLWRDMTAIPSTTLNNVERTILLSLGYLGNIPTDSLGSFIFHLRACSIHLCDSDSNMAHRVLDDVLAVNKAKDINTTFVRYQRRKKKPAVIPLQEPLVIHAPLPVKPLTCLPDPNNWCPAADPIVNKNPRAMGIAPGSQHFAPDFRQATTALDLLELITQGKGTGMRSWGAAVGGPLSTFGARLAHTVGLYGPCQPTLG